MQTEERKEAKRCFSRIGWYIFSILVITSIVQVVLLNVIPNVWPEALESQVVTWICVFAPMYVIAVPLSSLILKKLPVKNIEKKKMTAAQILCCVPIAIFLMYVGNMIGILIMNLINFILGIQMANPLEMLVEGPFYLRLIVVVIVGPLMEEYIFRKQLIDHTRMYGEKTAVLLSAVLFGLFHGNLSQMFYACALGLLFGYIYLRTGTIRYSAMLHMFVNFLGGVVAPFLLSRIDMEANTFSPAMFTQDNIVYICIFMIYTLSLLTLGILGMILFFINLKKVYFNQEDQELPKGVKFRTIFLNVGMLLFIALIIWSVLKTIFI